MRCVRVCVCALVRSASGWLSGSDSHSCPMLTNSSWMSSTTGMPCRWMWGTTCRPGSRSRSGRPLSHLFSPWYHSTHFISYNDYINSPCFFKTLFFVSCFLLFYRQRAAQDHDFAMALFQVLLENLDIQHSRFVQEESFLLQHNIRRRKQNFQVCLSGINRKQKGHWATWLEHWYLSDSLSAYRDTWMTRVPWQTQSYGFWKKRRKSCRALIWLSRLGQHCTALLLIT